MPKLSKVTIQGLKNYLVEKKTPYIVLKEVLDCLMSDVVVFEKLAVKQGDQNFRRAYARSIFAFTEGVAFRAKQYLVDASDDLRITISANERLVLCEQTVSIAEDGTIRRKESHPAHRQNIKFTLKFIARKLEDDSLNEVFNEPSWQHYCRALEKRHALTHPKFLEDVDVSDENLDELRGAHKWALRFAESILFALARRQE